MQVGLYPVELSMEWGQIYGVGGLGEFGRREQRLDIVQLGFDRLQIRGLGFRNLDRPDMGLEFVDTGLNAGQIDDFGGLDVANERLNLFDFRLNGTDIPASRHGFQRFLDARQPGVEGREIRGGRSLRDFDAFDRALKIFDPILERREVRSFRLRQTQEPGVEGLHLFLNGGKIDRAGVVGDANRSDRFLNRPDAFVEWVHVHRLRGLGHLDGLNGGFEFPQLSLDGSQVGGLRRLGDRNRAYRGLDALHPCEEGVEIQGLRGLRDLEGTHRRVEFAQAFPQGVQVDGGRRIWDVDGLNRGLEGGHALLQRVKVDGGGCIGDVDGLNRGLEGGHALPQGV